MTRQRHHNRHEQQDRHTPKPKFQEQRERFQLENPIKPMNKKQAAYIELLNSKDVIIASGFAGTSKTYLPTAIACDFLRLGKIGKIVFSRPNVSNSKSLGFFSGSLEEKMANWLSPVIDVVNERMGVGGYETAVNKGQIRFQPLETIKGLSVSGGWLIVDEAEDLTVDEVKKVITRVGKDCKLILAGDVTQAELGEKSGLKWLIDFVKRHDLDDIVGHIDFNDPNDIVRSNAVKRFIVALNRDTRAGIK